MDFSSKSSSSSSLSLSLTINLNGSSDPSYRYKMEPLKVTYIAKNGGTTIINNAKQISKDIYRAISDLKSCFAKGTAGSVHIIDDTLSITGDHKVSELQLILMNYIKLNVMCKGCGNPETVLWKKRKRKCQACGKVLIM